MERPSPPTELPTDPRQHLSDDYLASLAPPREACYPADPQGSPYLDSDIPPALPSEAVAWVNQRYFVAFDGGKALVMCDEKDEATHRAVLRCYSFPDFSRFFQNRYVETTDAKGNPKNVPLGKYWLDSPSRRQYRGVVLAPKSTPRGYYNLWRGFSVTPKEGDWSLMEAHIRENICQNHQESYTYVRKWLAFAVQNPDRLPQTALVMRGKQGTGKGVFARGFGELFGQHFLHLNQAGQLVGTFNSHLRDALVVFADEAFLAGDKNSEGTLKALISEPDLQIHQKFKDLVTAKNMIHLIAASNNDLVISAAAEERRFCMLDVSDKRMQDHAYFAAIKAQLEVGGRAGMLHALLAEDLSGFNILQIPKTGALRDQKLRSLAPGLQWWLSVLQSGRLTNAGWADEVPKDDLVSHCAASTRRPWNPQTLRSALLPVMPHGFPEDGSRPFVNGRRIRHWRFPSLEDCRARFDEVFGTDGSQWTEEN